MRVYWRGGAYCGRVSQREARVLENDGMLASVTRDATGRMRKAIRMQDEAGSGCAVQTLASLQGTRYSYRQRLPAGRRAWAFQRGVDGHAGVGAQAFERDRVSLELQMNASALERLRMPPDACRS